MAIDESFVINLADAPAIGAPRGATFIRLEPDGVTWPDTGVSKRDHAAAQRPRVFVPAVDPEADEKD